MPKVSGALKKVALAVGGLAFFEFGARIGLPGVNVEALGSFLSQIPRNGLLGLYNVIGGGGLGRGAILALGIVPYVSASVMMRLIRVVSPRVETLSETSEGHDRLIRWTRGLTLAIAAIQGCGFAQFLQKTPGVVANPGVGFTAQTMLILTAGSAVAMMLTEALLSRSDGDDEAPDNHALLDVGEAPAVPLRTAESISRD